MQGSPTPEAPVTLEVDLAVYALPAVLRACYKFTDRCYLQIERDLVASRVLVAIRPKQTSTSSVDFKAEFLNELIDQQIRENLNAEVGALRLLIVQKALSEGGFSERDADPSDDSDPLGILRTP